MLFLPATVLFLMLGHLRISGIHGLTWNDNVGTDLKTCVGKSFSFDWNYTYDDNTETVTSRQWTAVLNGQTVDLLSERPTEFRLNANGGLTLRSATVAHTGEYSFEVTTTNKTGRREPNTYKRSASLQVSEKPLAKGGWLNLTMHREAVKIRSGNKTDWGIQLRCGEFRNRGQPPVSVVWTTPLGKVLPSTSYESGSFRLTLISVESGVYSCEIDPKAPASVCLDQDINLLDTAQIHVDETEVQLMFGKARIADLETLVAALVAKDSEREAGGRTTCPSGWTKFGSSCYAVSTNKFRWVEAQTTCKLYGATLAEVESSAESEFLKGIARSNKYSCTWLGGARMFQHEQYIWAGSRRLFSAVGFTDWAEGEPSESAYVQHCVQLWPEHDYRWDNIECLFSCYFFCEIVLSGN